MSDLESKIAKAMNLDTSQRYFTSEGGTILMKIPENCTPGIIAEISTYLKPKIAEAVDAGQNKAVIDVHQLRSLHMGVIKLLMQAMQTCRELGVQYALVGNSQIVSECKGFEDTRTWHFYDTADDAKGSFTKAAPPAPALASAS
jgi:two-component system cell cycle response regulator